MTQRRTIPIDTLRALVRCDPVAGKLYWRERTADLFAAGNTSAESRCDCWNRRYAGEEAFMASSNGYRTGSMLGRTIPAHRVIWALVHGEWPEQVDHQNGVTHDNRIENLRAVTPAGNARNRRRPVVNTSGAIGVHFDDQAVCWRARVKFNGKTVHLGTFASMEAAVAARRAAEASLGFHHNHGRAA